MSRRPTHRMPPSVRPPVSPGDSTTPQFIIALSDPTAADAEANALSAVQSGDAADTAQQTTAAAPVDDTTAAALLARLTPMPDLTVDEAEFNRREQSLAPPRGGGRIIDLPFPPPQQPRPVDSIRGDNSDEKALAPAPLLITRSTPANKQAFSDTVVDVTLTFSQPMIGLSTVEQTQTQAASAPASITPSIPGEWRWTGSADFGVQRESQISVFNQLLSSVSRAARRVSSVAYWRTPSHSTLPRRRSESPSLCRMEQSRPLRPVILLAFNQRVSPEAVLAHTALVSGTSKPIPIQLVPTSVATAEYEHMINRYLERTWIAFQPAVDLVKNSEYRVTVSGECPSAEGPITNIIIITLEYIPHVSAIETDELVSALLQS